MNVTRPQASAICQVDNEDVVVTEWRFAVGAETGWHRHGMDYVVVPMTSGTLLIESEEGETISTLTAGQSYFRKAGVRHNVVNNNDHEFVFVETEIR